MMKSSNYFITKTQLNNVRPVYKNASEVIDLYAQIKKIFEQSDSYLLFAEPVINNLDNNYISWFTELNGQPICFVDLDEEEQENLKIKLKNEIENLYNIIRKFNNNDYVSFLDSIIEIPDMSSIYKIKNSVVLVLWGFVSDIPNPNRLIIRKIIKDLSTIKTKQITIKVFDNNKIPLENIHIELFADERKSIGETDRNGNIIFPDIPIGCYARILLSSPQIISVEKNLLCEKNKDEYPIIVEKVPPVIIPPPEDRRSGCLKKILWVIFIILLIILCLLLLRKCSCNPPPPPGGGHHGDTVQVSNPGNPSFPYNDTYPVFKQEDSDTNELHDIKVNTGTVTIRIYDNGTHIDGDIINLTINSDTILSNYTLPSPEKAESFNVTLKKGKNYIEITAVSEGTASTATVMISISNVIFGKPRQESKQMSKGESDSFVIEF